MSEAKAVREIEYFDIDGHRYLTGGMYANEVGKLVPGTDATWESLDYWHPAKCAARAAYNREAETAAWE